MLSFRLAAEKDLQNILDSYNASIPGRMATADLEPQSMEERKKWFEKHRSVNRPAWVMEDNGSYAGWLSFSNFYGRPAYAATVEFSLYLDAKYQGKGLGKKAVEFALVQAPSLGIRTILAYVFGHNAPSISLFKKMGFEEWGHFPSVANMDGIQRDLIIFGKRLA